MNNTRLPYSGAFFDENGMSVGITRSDYKMPSEFVNQLRMIKQASNRDESLEADGYFLSTVTFTHKDALQKVADLRNRGFSAKVIQAASSEGEVYEIWAKENLDEVVIDLAKVDKIPMDLVKKAALMDKFNDCGFGVYKDQEERVWWIESDAEGNKWLVKKSDPVNNLVAKRIGPVSSTKVVASKKDDKWSIKAYDAIMNKLAKKDEYDLDSTANYEQESYAEFLNEPKERDSEYEAFKMRGKQQVKGESYPIYKEVKVPPVDPNVAKERKQFYKNFEFEPNFDSSSYEIARDVNISNKNEYQGFGRKSSRINSKLQEELEKFGDGIQIMTLDDVNPSLETARTGRVITRSASDLNAGTASRLGASGNIIQDLINSNAFVKPIV